MTKFNFFNKTRIWGKIKIQFNSIRLAISVFNGLIYAMAHKGLSGPHLFMESMANSERLSKFVIGIITQMFIWVNGNMFDNKDKAFQSIRNVRSIHSHIGKKMNQREGRVEGMDILWISQLGNLNKIINYLLAMTQIDLILTNINRDLTVFNHLAQNFITT